MAREIGKDLLKHATGWASDDVRVPPKEQAMTWTKEKPTRAGWYWYRHYVGDFPTAVLVWPTDKADFVVKGGLWRDSRLLSNLDGEWYGPLLMPPNQ